MALLGGMAFFLSVFFGNINHFLIENVYRGDIISKLYTKKELNSQSLENQENPAMTVAG